MENRSVTLLRAKVGHKRFWPKENSFLYRVFYVNTPIIAHQNSIKRPAFFSYNRWNVLSLRTKDYGAKDSNISWHEYISGELQKANITLDSDWNINLLSHPRLFGYAFNPISYWLITDGDGSLRAVLCEVHNTFGDNHNYLLQKSDTSAISPTDILTAEKRLYVSPFNENDGFYKFTFRAEKDIFKSTIAYHDRQRLLVDTYMGGSFSALTNGRVILTILQYPLMTLLVVARIHWQAVKLVIKRVPLTLKRRERGYKNNRTTAGKEFSK